MTMNKEYKYRGSTFNIKVELYTSQERCIDGKKYHTVTVNDMGMGSFYKKEEIEEKFLKMYLKMDVPIIIEKYVDEQLDGAKGIEKELKDLGFE